MKTLLGILACGIFGGIVGGLAGLAIEKYFPKKNIDAELDNLRRQYNI